MNTRGKEKVIVWVSMTFLFVVVIASVFSLYFFGILGLMRLTGVRYYSITSLLLFVVLYVVISILTDVFSKIAKVLITARVSRLLGKMFVRMGIDFLFSWLALHLADELMSGIDLHLESEIILAVVLAVAEEAFRNPKQGRYKLSPPT
jgi:hypothetical protein